MSKENCQGFEALFAQPLICGVFWSRNDKTLQLAYDSRHHRRLVKYFCCGWGIWYSVVVNEYSLSLWRAVGVKMLYSLIHCSTVQSTGHLFNILRSLSNWKDKRDFKNKMFIICRNKQEIGIIKNINCKLWAFFLFKEMIDVLSANVLDMFFFLMYERKIVHHIAKYWGDHACGESSPPIITVSFSSFSSCFYT